jgi:hypothetical protein
LNLQTCGVLINYDMPWNPMRVEQRIGRIDRIGQDHKMVWIRNYFYQDTVEARVYQALADRIGWFEDVVGELQPILAQVGYTIQTVAMIPEAERQRVLDEEVARLRRELDSRQAALLNLDEYVEAGEPPTSATAPVTLADLEALLTGTPSLKERFQPHPQFERAYLLQTDSGEVAVTFDVALFDEHPNTLRLLSYGSKVLAALLESVEAPEWGTLGNIVRFTADTPLPLRAYYTLDDKGQPRRIERLADLRAALAIKPESLAWSEEALATARADFEREQVAWRERLARATAARQRGERLALEEQARQILLRAALVELAMGQQPEMFEQEALPTAFTEEAVTGLKRHDYPFAPLLRLVNVEGMRPSPTDPFYTEVQGQAREALKRQFIALRDKAAHLVGLLANALNQEELSQNLPDVAA